MSWGIDDFAVEFQRPRPLTDLAGEITNRNLNFEGFAALMGQGPRQTGTIGGINRAEYGFWQATQQTTTQQMAAADLLRRQYEQLLEADRRYNINGETGGTIVAPRRRRVNW